MVDSKASKTTGRGGGGGLERYDAADSALWGKQSARQGSGSSGHRDCGERLVSSDGVDDVEDIGDVCGVSGVE